MYKKVVFYFFFYYLYMENKNMTKTLKIDVELHRRIKTYCSQNMLKLNQWIEKVLQNEINKVEKKDERKNRMD